MQWVSEERINKGVLLMLKRFTVVLVVLMIVVLSVSTVVAAPIMSDSKKTMNDLIKEEPMITNEAEMKTAFKDQMVLMMYIRAIDQIMKVMTPDQIKTTAQSFLKTQGTQGTKEQLMISIHTKMLEMNQDQLSSMLSSINTNVASLNAQRNMLKDNFNEMTMKIPGQHL